MDKKQLSERDICTKYITPALQRTGWNIQTQIREEFPLTDGKIIVRGKLHSRGRPKRADYVLFYQSNLPLAVLEAKDNNHSVGDGMQQALQYRELLQVPFAFSSMDRGFASWQFIEEMSETQTKFVGCSIIHWSYDLIPETLI